MKQDSHHPDLSGQQLLSPALDKAGSCLPISMWVCNAEQRDVNQVAQTDSSFYGTSSSVLDFPTIILLLKHFHVHVWLKIGKFKENLYNISKHNCAPNFLEYTTDHFIQPWMCSFFVYIDHYIKHKIKAYNKCYLVNVSNHNISLWNISVTCSGGAVVKNYLNILFGALWREAVCSARKSLDTVGKNRCIHLLGHG